ncbi:MAG: ABC-F family ATP-binding cassette domain-containing protein [Armatimonadota bacterium]
MAVLTVSGIKKSFGKKDLFEDITFTLNDKDRVAIIGDNGTGKTTLLRIIMGEVKQTSGSIILEKGISIGYLPQEIDLNLTKSLLKVVSCVNDKLTEISCDIEKIESKIASANHEDAEKLAVKLSDLNHLFADYGGYDYEVQAKVILLGLGFNESDFDKPLNQFSGGQKTRAALARLLLMSPDILLLDEPTNHLDITACEWLQEFLNERFQGSAIIVSHDRYFMDAVVNKIVELENGLVNIYPGNYTSYSKFKAQKVEEQKKQYKAQQKEIARLESAIQTLFSHRKFSRRDSKVKQLEKIEKISNISQKKTIKANLQAGNRSGRNVVKLESLSKSYPDKNLFADVKYIFERGTKTGIIGPNGSGKTTLLKIIAGMLTPDEGEVIMGHNVNYVYFAQEFDHIDQNNSVLEELLAESDISSKEARDLLAEFLFMGDDAFKPVAVLSGGEMCRLALAKVMAENPNLLLLDEPTNHLDISSREALEDSIKLYKGTVITASHDRYFLDAVCDNIIEIKDGDFKYYPGNYTEYKSRSTSVDEAVNPEISNKNEQLSKERVYSPLKQQKKRLTELQSARKKIEEDIVVYEDKINELTIALGDETNYKDGNAKELTEEYNKYAELLNCAYLEWEILCDEISSVEDSISSIAQ